MSELNRKQWKCKSVPTNDWNSKENAKQWRKDFVETINAVNERMNMTDDFWEYRSFKEQGIELEPQIHLGEKASAIPVKVVTAVKNEILDMIREIAKRNNNRMNLPVFKGEFLGKISDRSALQRKDWMESFVHDMGWTTFDEMNAERQTLKQSYDKLLENRTLLADRINYLSALLDKYDDYKPYIKNHKEQWAVTGWARKKYEREHIAELGYYDYAKIMEEGT